MEKQDINQYDKSYHPPETIRLDYCAAVLAVVLKHHPEAKELYENIKDCILLPGVQETFSTVENKIPEGDKLIKGMVTKAGYKKNSKPDENSAKSARRLMAGAKEAWGRKDCQSALNEVTIPFSSMLAAIEAVSSNKMSDYRDPVSSK